MQGTARWFKPERPLDIRYPGAFSTSHTVLGGLYVPPPIGTPPLTWDTGGAGVLTISGGNLTTALTQQLTLGINPVASWTTLTIPSLRLNVNAASGSIGGNFLHSDGITRAFRGVIIQRLGGAWGNFSGATETGPVSLEASVK